MEIENNYEGASIDIIRNEKNKIYLSLKKENGKYSHYYNFRIKNNLDEQGIIYIKNITNSAYYKKESFSAPYIKENNQWKKVEEYVIDDKGRLVLKVKQKTTCEISLLPRYVQKNLDEFIEKNNLNNLKISKNPLNEIIIGDRNLPSVVIVARQHPGETLSSFFVEGIIQEIINDTKLKNKYCFVFYPLLNEDGVNNGNHRYLENIDYNRSWNKKNAPKEIKYIKEKLKDIQLKYFIDIHNDEISKKNYIRISNKKIQKNKIAGIDILVTQSKLKRFIRALIKQKKLINIFSKTANEYVYKKYKCKTILVELSMSEKYENINELGKKFIKEMMGE